MGWQRDLLNDLFVLRPDGHRQYRTAYIGLPRKNGKSTIGSALALYGLIADGEPGAEVYSCAGDRKQASIVFDEAKRMVEANPEFAEAGVVVRRYHIEGPRNSVYRVLSADASLQQGLNPSMVLFDEVHVQPNGDLWDAMTLGSGTRRQPLIVAITTAGFDETTLAYRLYDYGQQIARGEIEDPTFFFRWWEAPKGSNYQTEAYWRAANPALAEDGFLKLEDLEAAARATPESSFRRFRGNEWTTTETVWLPYGTWNACRSDVGLDPKLPVSVGIDIGLSDDSTAVVIAQKQGDVTVVRAKFWANPYPKGTALREEWKFDTEIVVAYLRELRDKYPVPAVRIDDRTIPGPAFCYDPWSFKEPANRLSREGLAMIEVPQNDTRMVPASRVLFDAVVNKRIGHDDNPILAAHLANVTPEERGDRGWRLTKPKGSSRKIDGAIALTMAVFQAQAEPPQRPMRAFAV